MLSPNDRRSTSRRVPHCANKHPSAAPVRESTSSRSEVDASVARAPIRAPCEWQFPFGGLRRAPKAGSRHWRRRSTAPPRPSPSEPSARVGIRGECWRVRWRRLGYRTSASDTPADFPPSSWGTVASNMRGRQSFQVRLGLSGGNPRPRSADHAKPPTAAPVQRAEFGSNDFLGAKRNIKILSLPTSTPVNRNARDLKSFRLAEFR